MKKIYEVADHCFGVIGETLCNVVCSIPGFRPFETEKEDTLFSFVDGNDVPVMQRVQYSFTYEDVTGTFGRFESGYMLVLTPENRASLNLWINDGSANVEICGNVELYLLRFALWVGYGLMTLPFNTVAIHSSCIVYNEKAVLFLGESGTGKSTHTRLWRESIQGASLLNDDSPIIRVEDGIVWAYGSPWSGKTPCYKAERYQLKGCVRLSQAPENNIKRLSVLQAYGAIHPSCPPEFAYDTCLYDYVSGFINQLLTNVPFFHLVCLPDYEAAQLSCTTLFPDEL